MRTETRNQERKREKKLKLTLLPPRRAALREDQNEEFRHMNRVRHFMHFFAPKDVRFIHIIT